MNILLTTKLQVLQPSPRNHTKKFFAKVWLFFYRIKLNEFWIDLPPEIEYYSNSYSIFGSPPLREKRNEIVLCNVLTNSNSVVIFSLDKLTHVFLSEHFANARFFSSISPQIEYLTIKSKQSNCKKLYTNINSGYIDVISMENGRLMLANTYQSVSSNDINYFLLNIWQKTGFSQERDELHITGIQDIKNTVIPEMKKYISHVYSINPQAEFNNSTTSKIENIPFDVQSLILCE